MKKVLSLFMVVCLLLGCSATVLADETKSTTVKVVGESACSYEFNVPTSMTAGETKPTTLEGTWDSFTTIKVTAPSTVTLVNDSNGTEKVLGVEYAGFDIVGNDFTSIEEESDVTVAATDILFGTWEGIITYNLTVETEGSSTSSNPLAHNGIIPEGGTYYVSATSMSENTNEYTYDGDYSLATAVYEAGDEFPAEVNDGDVYVYGDYEYRYNFFNLGFWVDRKEQNGWGVRVRDVGKSEYAPILEEINNEVITSLCATFSLCESLETSPVIPNTVKYMMETFGNSSLTNAPIIPTSVIEMPYIFINCDNLTGEVEINATNLSNYIGCFNDIEQPIVLTGTCPQLADIAAQYDNVTVEE